MKTGGLSHICVLNPCPRCTSPVRTKPGTNVPIREEVAP